MTAFTDQKSYEHRSFASADIRPLAVSHERRLDWAAAQISKSRGSAGASRFLSGRDENGCQSQRHGCLRNRPHNKRARSFTFTRRAACLQLPFGIVGEPWLHLEVIDSPTSTGARRVLPC